MPDVISTVGSDVSRDYSTLVAAEADLTDITYPDADTHVFLDMYDDSDFIDDNTNFNWNGETNIVQVTVRAASGQEHLGVVGGGVTMTFTVNLNSGALNVGTGVVNHGPTNFVGIEIEGNEKIRYGIQIGSPQDSQTSAIHKRMMIHNIRYSNQSTRGITTRKNINLENCIVFNVITTNGGSDNTMGIHVDPSASAANIFNCSVHNIFNNNGSGAAWGIFFEDGASYVVKNCIATVIGGTSSGSKECFSSAAYVNADLGYNISDDATATGTGSLTLVSAADLFISTTQGAENLDLLETAVAIGAGIDLTGVQDDIETSIDNVDRTTIENWAIGAFQPVVSKIAENIVLSDSFCEGYGIIKYPSEEPEEDIGYGKISPGVEVNVNIDSVNEKYQNKFRNQDYYKGDG